MVDYDSSSDEEDEVNMKLLHNRVESFYNDNWKVRFLTHMSLANAGFFYTGVDDRVKCAYCSGNLQSWEEGDIPMLEHRKHFPNCSLVRSLRPSAAALQHGEDVCGIYENIPSTVPMIASMIDFHERLRSFKNWPKNRRQSTREMAAAGLFYLGEGDDTKCFQCGEGLKHWDPEDSPWVEHAKWYPHCQHVIAVKGQRFVDLVRERSSSSGSAGEDRNLSSSQESSSSQGSNSSDDSMESDEDEEEHELKIIMEVFRQKFSQSVVEQALKERRANCGRRFQSAEELIGAVKSIEEKKE